MNADRFFLEEVGTITKADNLRKREVQVNTRIHYAQRRWAFTDSMVWLQSENTLMQSVYGLPPVPADWCRSTSKLLSQRKA